MMTSTHINNLQVFCAEHGVTKDEADRLFDTSEHGPIARALDAIRNPAMCGLWSKETKRRYLGGM